MLASLAVIGILLGLALTAGSGVITESNRRNAMGQISAMVTAFEAYKTDNGIYPVSGSLVPGSYANNDGTMQAYWKTSEVVYSSLSGQSNFTSTPASGARSYMSFKRSMVADTNTGSYVVDPWGYSIGYFSGTGTVTPVSGRASTTSGPPLAC